MVSKLNKKGMSSSTINWIFVMVAGAVILLFIFRIIGSRGEINELEISSKILEDLGSILVGRSVSADSFTEIDISSDRIFFIECKGFCNPNTGCDSYVSGSHGGKQIDTSVRPIFSAERIRYSPKLYSFVESWKVPFNIVNFVYLAYPGQKYIFPKSCSGTCLNIYNKIPNRLKLARIVVKNEGDPVLVGNEKFVKMVYFDTCPSNGNGAPTGNQRGVCITETINFWNGTAWDKSFGYLTDEEILGAIFTENAENYECNMRKAEYKYNIMLPIYKNKVEKLNSINQNTNCRFYFSRGGQVDNIIRDYSILDGENLFERLKNLKDSNVLTRTRLLNERLMREDCSLIY